MMRKNNPFLLISVILILSSVFTEANAQGLGGLLKKAKSTVEKIDKTVSKNSNATESQAPVSQDNNFIGIPGTEISVMNPIARYIDVVPVGLFAYSENENFGKAYLVLRVTNFTEKESVFFGSSVQNKKMLAVDPLGNVLNVDAGGGYRMDCPSDITVNVVLDQPALHFENVARNIAVMPMVKIGVNIDASRQGNLTFKNVPVFWDQSPE
ncbi:MAG: hypothetical protein K2G85_00695 [Muribaculaceae bacterium]|nr:hypothetical protein [Muribaculaceae bacterium]